MKKELLLLLLLLLTIAIALAYAPQANNAEILFNFTNTSYATIANNAEGVYEMGEANTTTTGACEYSGSGNWVLDCAAIGAGKYNACEITTTYDLQGKNVTFSGDGDVTVRNYPLNVSVLTVNASCIVTFDKDQIG